ncbi:hypothetical protein OE88DRAFT_1255659 [Heliocybe sulcata]|uniref:Fungal-type protein kinase domain-containing protein n=1 Tax=Heliocybe sulcata TaxID=5364 RepID=A0A5C3N8I0_9AGAM|nr:hypothetical protein OE88DRAFT_1255659 [Heliocybe sulcata]
MEKTNPVASTLRAFGAVSDWPPPACGLQPHRYFGSITAFGRCRTGPLPNPAKSYPTSRPQVASTSHLLFALTLAWIPHRDISLDNIMLMESSDGTRRRLRSDLDYAIDWPPKADRQSGRAYRTGYTTPFMACDLLMGAGLVPHDPQWDLESFLYILIWICVLYSAPENRRRKVDFGDTLMAAWTAGNFFTIGSYKSYHMYSPAGFQRILNDFDPYFEDLKSCVFKWRNLYFPIRSGSMHEELLSILQEACALLPDVDHIERDEVRVPNPPAPAEVVHSGMPDIGDPLEGNVQAQLESTSPKGSPAPEDRGKSSKAGRVPRTTSPGDEESTREPSVLMVAPRKGLAPSDTDDVPRALPQDSKDEPPWGKKRGRGAPIHYYSSPESRLIPAYPTSSGGSRRSWGTFTPSNRSRSPSSASVSEHQDEGDVPPPRFSEVRQIARARGTKLAAPPRKRPRVEREDDSEL